MKTTTENDKATIEGMKTEHEEEITNLRTSHTQELTDLKTSHDAVQQVNMWSRCEKTGLRGFQPGPTKTRLYNYRRLLET